MEETIQNIKRALEEKFQDLKFEEKEHKYTLDGKVLPSVSSLVSKFYEKFDSYNTGLKYADKYSFEAQDVWDAWEGESNIASVKGNRVHEFGENYCRWKFFNEGKKPKITCKQCLGIVQFWNNLPSYLVPVAFELRMYNRDYGFAGTTDILCVDTRDSKLVIMDYKSNKDIFDAYGEKPLLNIPSNYNLIQNDFGKYTIQFSLYQLLLEEAGFEVKGRVLIWLNEDKENNKLYRTYQTLNLTNELRKIIQHDKEN